MNFGSKGEEAKPQPAASGGGSGGNIIQWLASKAREGKLSVGESHGAVEFLSQGDQRRQQKVHEKKGGAEGSAEGSNKKKQRGPPPPSGSIPLPRSVGQTKGDTPQAVDSTLTPPVPTGGTSTPPPTGKDIEAFMKRNKALQSQERSSEDTNRHQVQGLPVAVLPPSIEERPAVSGGVPIALTVPQGTGVSELPPPPPPPPVFIVLPQTQQLVPQQQLHQYPQPPSQQQTQQQTQGFTVVEQQQAQGFTVVEQQQSLEQRQYNRDGRQFQPRGRGRGGAGGRGYGPPRGQMEASLPPPPPQYQPPPAPDLEAMAPEEREAFLKWQQQQEQTMKLRVKLSKQLQAQEQVRVDLIEQQRLDLSEVLERIEANQVTFICTDTGTGKSTSVPKALLELNSTTRIVTTQPRRTATINIAERVAALRKEEIGKEVGYWIRGDRKGGENTRLWYMTSYTLLLYLLRNPLRPPFTHIILDEFHERQTDLEVTVALLKLCLKHHTSDFKLIIMSATLSTEAWENYFEGLSVATYKQSEPEHPIHDYFLDEVCSMVGMSYEPPRLSGLHHVENSLVDNSMAIAQQAIAFINQASAPQQSILVFLPGRAQVESMAMWLEMNLRNRVEAIQWHSAVDLAVIDAAIRRPSTRYQKVYLATDIAEVSITLPDVVFVIDLGFLKRPQIIPYIPASVLYPPLATHWVSKGNIAQRRGRVGRVQQGFYFCLLTCEHIESLADYCSPPIEHSRIDELALHCLQIVGNPVALFSLCRSQPTVAAIRSSMNNLLHYGCILPDSDPKALRERIEFETSMDVESPTRSVTRPSAASREWSPLVMQEAQSKVEGAKIESYSCTFIGRLLQITPVSIAQGVLIFYGFLTGLESLMVLTAAITSSLPPFLPNPMNLASDQKGNNRRRIPRDTFVYAMEKTEASMRKHAGGVNSDVVSMLRAVLRFKIQQLSPDSTEDSLRHWCNDECISYDRTIAILELDAHIKFELCDFVPFVDIDDPVQLLQQVDSLGPAIVVLCSSAFAPQALEVVSSGNVVSSSKETALGIFNDLKALPDLNSPSAIRWEMGDVVVPVSVALRYSHMLVSLSSTVKSRSQFFLSLLLLSYRVHYAVYSDEDGQYMVMRVTFCGVSRYFEVEYEVGEAIVEFRKRCCRVCRSLRIRYTQCRDMTDEDFERTLMEDFQLPSFAVQQREVLMSITHYFFADGLAVENDRSVSEEAAKKEPKEEEKEEDEAKTTEKETKEEEEEEPTTKEPKEEEEKKEQETKATTDEDDKKEEPKKEEAAASSPPRPHKKIVEVQEPENPEDLDLESILAFE